MHVDLSWWKTWSVWLGMCFPAPPSRGLWVLLVRPELVSPCHVWSWMVQESTHMWYLPWTLWRPLHVKKPIPVTSPILVVWFNLYLIFSRIDNCNNAHSGCIAGFVFLMLKKPTGFINGLRQNLVVDRHLSHWNCMWQSQQLGSWPGGTKAWVLKDLIQTQLGFCGSVPATPQKKGRSKAARQEALARHITDRRSCMWTPKSLPIEIPKFYEILAWPKNYQPKVLVSAK